MGQPVVGDEDEGQAPLKTPLEEVQGVAKNWTTTTTALFGLFSLGGVVIGGDALAKVHWGWQLAVGVFAIAAVVLAALALAAGARAGYGWPEKPPKTGLGSVIDFATSAPVKDNPVPATSGNRQARRAVDDLESSLAASGAALAALIISVVLLSVATALGVEDPNVTITTATQSSCRQLVKIEGQLVTVQNALGRDEVIDVKDAGTKIEAGCKDGE